LKSVDSISWYVPYFSLLRVAERHPEVLRELAAA
jgi:hypothetical protein